MLPATWDLRAVDAFELIDEPEDGSVQLTITSPPYNIGKRYERRLLPFYCLSKTPEPADRETVALVEG